ncbi:hypothetical protein HAX54_027215 [Datura stramonium]|uniref:Uncharacterized protein n=1 Tax=Datura stramonium TaxID=4076 RepID=A0ABS8S8G7_DATST|nr:hypothetical protein [Datura stramonium]
MNSNGISMRRGPIIIFLISGTPIVPLTTDQPIHFPGFSTRSCACGEACLRGLLQRCHPYDVSRLGSGLLSTLVVHAPLLDLPLCALLWVATDLLVPCLDLSKAMACTVLSSSLTLALCVSMRLVLRPNGATFSPWPWSYASSISYLQLSHGTAKHIPHSIPSTCTVQRRPTTARLGQWTLARMVEPLPSSQVNSRGSSESTSIAQSTRRNQALTRNPQIPLLARERAALTLATACGRRQQLDPWAPPKSLANTFGTLRTCHATSLHACCLVPCPFASCSYFSPSSPRAAWTTDTHAAHPERITLAWSMPNYFRAYILTHLKSSSSPMTYDTDEHPKSAPLVMCVFHIMPSVVSWNCQT